ncbi:MAG: histidine ammonia-lyase [Bacteroidota bacterium]
MSSVYAIHNQALDFTALARLLKRGDKIQLDPECISKINTCRAYLEQKLQTSEALFYGINTGFGALCNIRISDSEITKLQQKLVQSHACGLGEEVPADVVRLMLFLKIQSLAHGHSAIRLETIEKLIYFYNNDILPIIYQQGSLGASGDLSPLAHMALPLVGLGEVRIKGVRSKVEEVKQQWPWQEFNLVSKEGLALINGTQFSAAYGAWCLIQSRRLLQQANLIAALSLEAFDCHLAPFDHRLHEIRPHSGQKAVAHFIRQIIAGSQMAHGEKENVQDPYAFRCVPQVHGASWQAIDHIESVLLTEINSVTDNPNLFPEEDAIISGGNFHAQPTALVLDYLAIALAELGSISERRTYQLISGQRGLPPFLSTKPGLYSGLMIPQYTAASIVSQNKQLCHPASVDSIVSSNGQEDHVSMAANAATKAYRVVNNLKSILAIELLTAAQAMDFRRPKKTSPRLEKLLQDYRKEVTFLETDRQLYLDMQATIRFLDRLALIDD